MNAKPIPMIHMAVQLQSQLEHILFSISHIQLHL
jgi:hypothetical protein